MTLFSCQYTDAEIVLLFGGWPYKRISYVKIQGITIRGAVDQAGYPIKKNNKQRAVVSGYDSPYSLLTYMRKDGISFMPFSYEHDLLFHSYINEGDFETLLMRTDVPIYVTKEMMDLHKESLSNVLQKYSERVKVAINTHMDDFEGYVSLSQYLKNSTR